MSVNEQVEIVKQQAIAIREKSKPLEALIKSSTNEFKKALPKFLDVEALQRAAITMIKQNNELVECEPITVIAALMMSAQLGLLPNVDGQAYVVPCTNSKKVGNQWTKTKEAQFWIGYKGLINLFYRDPLAKSYDIKAVHKNDIFKSRYGTNPELIHEPDTKDRGEPYLYYAVAHLQTGGCVFEQMTHQECIEHAKSHSKCWITKEKDQNTGKYVDCVGHFKKNTPWDSDTVAMCKKTTGIQLCKVLPKSIYTAKALSFDGTIKRELSADMLNVPDVAVWSDTINANGKEVA